MLPQLFTRTMKEKESQKNAPMRRSIFWLNIVAMLAVVVLAVFLTFRWMNAYTQHGKAILVPDVTGRGVRDAVYALSQAGMKVRLRGTGRVHEQSIPGGTRDAKGKTVTLNLK